MVDDEPVSAYAVYRNLVHVGNKNVNKLKKNRKKSGKRKNTNPSKGSTDRHNQPLKNKLNKMKQWKKRGAQENKLKGIAKSMTSAITNGILDNLPGPSTTSSTRSVTKSNLLKEPALKNGRSVLISNCPKTKKKIKGRPVQKSNKRSRSRKIKTTNDSCNATGSEEIETERSFQNTDNPNSFTKGQKRLSWLIHPATPEDFFKTAWEKRPLHIKRHIRNYYSSLLSTEKIDLMLREHIVQYSKNLDITSYVDGKKETHNPVGRAYASVVWDYYSNGCSIRLLNPQTFIEQVWHLCAALQDAFGCFVGANVYLTPPDSQGFAPHYDDIEAFILQVEGKKHWRLYAPLTSEECLPRYSSKNFTQEEIGEPILDVVLEPGDLLYFPRGVIHQGSTLPDVHSLHMTVSTYQRNTWGDFLEKLIPVALKTAMDEDPKFREGLPRDYLRYMGVAHSDYTSEGRNQFIQKVSDLMRSLFEFAPIDAAADQLGKQLMHDALPPFLSQEEKFCTIFEDGERMKKGLVSNRVELEPDTRIKILRGNILRLITEEDSIRVYHCVENSREYHAVEEPQYLELSAELAPAVEFLIHSYPVFVAVEDLPLDKLSDKLQLANDLWERGLVMTGGPLPVNED